MNSSAHMSRGPIWLLFFLLLWALSASAQNPFWREPLRLTNSPYITNGAEMAESGGIIHVVCNDSWIYGENGVYYYHSLDGGLSFSQGTRLDNDSSAWAQMPAVAAFAQKVHVVYEEHPNIGADVHIAYRRSTDAGVHWDSTQILNADAIRPRVACQGDTVYVLYNIVDEPRHSRFRYSYDAGRHWSQEIQLYPECVYPDLTACDGQVFIAYQHYIYPINEIYLRGSLNGGQSWQDPVQVSLSPGIPSQAPHIAVESGGFMAISWFDHENAPPGFTGYIQVRTSSDYGDNFASVEVVSTTPYCTSNDIAVCNRIVHVAYNDERWGITYSGVYYRQSLDRGSNWDPEEALSADSSRAQYPTIVAIPDWVYVVWEMSDSTGEDLYFIDGELALGMKASPIMVPSDVAFQIYPNPANPAAVASFELQVPSHVMLNVFDLLGRKIAILANGWFQAGRHQFAFNALKLSAGVYWVKLNYAGKVEVKPLTVTK